MKTTGINHDLLKAYLEILNGSDLSKPKTLENLLNAFKVIKFLVIFR